MAGPYFWGEGESAGWGGGGLGVPLEKKCPDASDGSGQEGWMCLEKGSWD